jgi:hypothetical protein
MAHPKMHSRFGTAVDEFPPHPRLISGADLCLEIALPRGAPEFFALTEERLEFVELCQGLTGVD